MTPTEIEPGAYAGTAVVSAGGKATALPIEVSAQDDRNGLVILATFVGVVAGLVVKYFSDRRQTAFGKQFLTPKTLVTVGAGVVTGVYSYLTIYANDPTFSAGFGNLWRVSAEAFAGTLAAKVLTDLAGRDEDSQSRGGAGGGGAAAR